MRERMRNYRKLIGTLLGSATGVGVALVLRAFGVEVEPELASAIALILASVGTYLAPKNVDTEYAE